MPDDRTIATELGTALGTLPYPDPAAALAARPGQLRVGLGRLGPPRDRAPVRTVRRRVGHRLRQRPGPAGGGRRAATPHATHHRVDRRPPAARGRGGPHRPAHRPRLPDQLQVRVGHPGQRLPGPGVRRAAGHAGIVGPGRLVRRRGPRGAGHPVPRLSGCHRTHRLPADPFGLQPGAAGHLAPGPVRALLPRRRLAERLCRAVPKRSARRRPDDGRSGWPRRAWGPRACCGGCSGSGARPTSSWATTAGPGRRPATGSPAPGTGGPRSSWRSSP